MLERRENRTTRESGGSGRAGPVRGRSRRAPDDQSRNRGGARSRPRHSDKSTTNERQSPSYRFPRLLGPQDPIRARRSPVEACLAFGQGCPAPGYGAFRKLSRMGLMGSLLRVHDQIYKRTDGRVGHGMLGVPTLLLRTTGRRSGATRSNALVYARDGDDYLLVPSAGGSDRPPAWFFNLQANPTVELQVGRQRIAAQATVIEHSDPRYQRLWKIVNANNRDRYSGYQRKTTRPIPVIAVTPS